MIPFQVLQYTYDLSLPDIANYFASLTKEEINKQVEQVMKKLVEIRLRRNKHS